MKRVLVSLLLLASITAAADGARPFNPAASPKKLAADFLRPSRLTALNGTRRVAIANFRVEFAVENSGEGGTSGSSVWNASKSVIKLVGITDSVRESIADQLYDKLVSGLQGTGVAVVPYETLRKVEGYRSLGPALKATQLLVTTQTGKSVFLGPHDLPIYFTSDDKHVSLSKALGGFGKQPQSLELRMAESLDATILRVTLAVALMDVTIGGPSWPGASSETRVALAFVPKLTEVLCVTPDDATARITLVNAVALPSDVLELRDVTPSAEQIAETVGSVLSGVYSGGIRKERRYEASAPPEKYQAAVTSYGTALEGAMVSLLRAPFLADSAE